MAKFTRSKLTPTRGRSSRRPGRSSACPELRPPAPRSMFTPTSKYQTSPRSILTPTSGRDSGRRRKSRHQLDNLKNVDVDLRSRSGCRDTRFGFGRYLEVDIRTDEISTWAEVDIWSPRVGVPNIPNLDPGVSNSDSRPQVGVRATHVAVQKQVGIRSGFWMSESRPGLHKRRPRAPGRSWASPRSEFGQLRTEFRTSQIPTSGRDSEVEENLDLGPRK